MYKRALLASALLLCASASLAQGRYGSGDLLERMDANSDGRVSREEFVSARGDMFTKRDKNADGYLDSADFGKRALRRARGAERMADMKNVLDTDRDGKISRDEFVNAATPLFDRADQDGNDVLDPAELESAKAAAKSRAEEIRSRRM